MENSQNRKRIAVIAVHGVGDQMPFDTAHRIGDLLQDLNVGKSLPGVAAGPVQQPPGYYPFHEQTIRVDVRPTVVNNPPPNRRGTAGRGPFDTWVKEHVKFKEPVTDDEIWYRFTKGQLSDYGGEKPEDTYQTVRMEGSRAPQNGTDQIYVHVYELYWADLSRLKAGMLSFFTELYQLLFHLPSLGVHTINAAAVHHRTLGWRLLRKLQSYTAGLLTVPIPIVNLFILATIVIVALQTVVTKVHAELTVSAVALVSIITVAMGWWLWYRLEYRRMASWRWLSPVLIAVGLAVGVFYSGRFFLGWAFTLQILSNCVISAVTAALLFLVFWIYDQRRPGALKWAIILCSILFVLGLGSVFYVSLDQPDLLTLFWVRQFEIADIVLLISWATFFVVGLGPLIEGPFAVGQVYKEDCGAVRSWWTGLLMLSLPALAFLIVTVGAWYLVANSIKPLLPAVDYKPLWTARFGIAHANEGAQILVNQIPTILQDHLGKVLKLLIAAATGSVLFAIWGLAPSLWDEIFPQTSPGNRGNSAKRLGRWLTLGFSGLLLSGIILYATTMLLLPSISAKVLMSERQLVDVPTSLAAISGAGIAAVFLARGRLKKLVLGSRPVLDILLDVDNWFREHPRDSNPKARIFGRYVSLLRYVCNWREDSTVAASGYDGVVIIAHSQGTVITADLLRFLKMEAGDNLQSYDGQLARLSEIPVYFFSMGCPLRQLYGQRFPHLYHWARHDDVNEVSKWKPNDIPVRRVPDPTELLGVKLWINCYRTGDYVGRFLWRTDSYDYVWTPDLCGSPPDAATIHNSTDGAHRLEFCIGAGSHTHYWDSTAIVVAKELDRLIGEIAAPAATQWSVPTN
jgi:hypothetical protein